VVRPPEGDAASDVANPDYGGGSTWGEEIEPLDEAEVIRFLEDHGGVTALEEHFSEAVEDA